MAEIRVQCPECQAKMKLTAAIEKVRCPKCETLFPAAENRVRASSPKKKKSPTPKRKPSSSSAFDFDDDFGDSGEDVFEEDLAPRKKRTKKSAPKPKRKRRKRTAQDELQAQQVRKFGFTMILLGVGAFVLPLVGLQIKGLNAMSPEMQAMGGVCFFILGGVVILFSYKDALGDTVSLSVDKGFNIVKWGAIGLFALVIGVPLLMMGVNMVLRTFNAGQAADHERAIQDIAEQDLNPNFLPPTAPGRPLRPSGGLKTPTGNRSAANSNASNREAESPFQDTGTSDSGGGFQPIGNPTQTGRPGRYPGMRTPTGNFKAPETVKVTLKGFPRREATQKMRQLMIAGTTVGFRVKKMEEDLVEVETDLRADFQTYVDLIPFGTVTSSDEKTRTITIEP